MSDKVANFLGISAGLLGVLVGAALVIAAVNLGPGLLAGWLVFLFRIVFFIFGTALLLCLAWLLGSLLFDKGASAGEKAIETIHRVIVRYQREIVMVKQRTPTLAAALFLLSEGIVIIADHSFGTDDAAAISFSLFLLGAFWVSNELCISDTRRIRILGYVLWVLAVTCLPLAVMVYGELTPDKFLQQLAALDLKIKISCGLGAVVLLLLPIVLADKEPHNEGLNRTAPLRGAAG